MIPPFLRIVYYLLVIRGNKKTPAEIIKNTRAKNTKGTAKLVLSFPIKFKRRGATVAPKLQPINTIALAVFKEVRGTFSGKLVKILETELVMANPQRKTPTAMR